MILLCVPGWPGVAGRSGSASADRHESVAFEQEPEDYCFVGIERHTKLVLNFALGKRNQATTDIFVEGLRTATSGKFQITTDGFGPYKSAIANTLEDRVDFAQLIKVYRAGTEGERRYSPAEVVSTEAAERRSWRTGLRWLHRRSAPDPC
jgi:transposase-like protein